jgi:hypothetical protein
MIFKNKKGLSEIIGYILLISFALIMSFIVYQGLITYVPVAKTECPDGTSIFVKSYTCTPEGYRYILNLTIKNNGKFDIAGFFVYGTIKENQTIATTEIVPNILNLNVEKVGNAIVFGRGVESNENVITLNDERTTKYNLTQKIYSLDITPARYQREDKRLRMVVCGNAKISEKIIC